MPKLARALILSCSLLAFAAPATAAQPAPTAAQASLHARLFQVFKESDEASLKRNPVQALLRGDERYADRLMISAKWVACVFSLFSSGTTSVTLTVVPSSHCPT